MEHLPLVSEISSDLGFILRFCISPEEFVPLRREIEVLERYIAIQRIRLSTDFTFRLDIPQNLEDVRIPKMILQPLVENAIIHGLEGRENSLIGIQAELDEEKNLLLLSVIDNGVGFPPSMTGRYVPPTQERPENLGLYNVDTILAKHYGSDFGLELSNPPQGGAKVTAILPYGEKARGNP
jgi:two-component system sensor histidine kinase YesM